MSNTSQLYKNIHIYTQPINYTTKLHDTLDSILYMKGINRRMLFQGVHMMMGAEPGKPWLASEKKNTKMVFIGRKLPQEIFTKGLEQCLAKS